MYLEGRLLDPWGPRLCRAGKVTRSLETWDRVRVPGRPPPLGDMTELACARDLGPEERQLPCTEGLLGTGHCTKGLAQASSPILRLSGSCLMEEESKLQETSTHTKWGPEKGFSPGRVWTLGGRWDLSKG